MLKAQVMQPALQKVLLERWCLAFVLVAGRAEERLAPQELNLCGNAAPQDLIVTERS